ncbi:MAG: acriflavin resistance protein [Moraxellaceae bacterium]|jgi:multidrug efflux pump subunit AcrB|nr:acriflavin resistance protein [Moraxellaceae bacterium]
MSDAPKGISGRIAAFFQESQLTPLLALVGFLLGVFAVLVTPREEEPQIDVTFANVFIPYPGASAKEIEQLITNNAEQVAMQIAGVEHVYSTSSPGMAMLGVRFEVGEKRTDAIVRLYNAFYEKQDWMPAGVNAGPVLIKPKGIDDVPVFAVTITDRDANAGSALPLSVARALETELKRVPGTRDVYTLGGPERIVQVALNAQRLATFGLAPDDLRAALQATNQSADAGSVVAGNAAIQVQAGTFLTRPEEVGALVVGLFQGRPVYLRDVAEVKLTHALPTRYVNDCAADTARGASQCRPAVTVAVTKKPGENAVAITDGLEARLKALHGISIPDNVDLRITRNYGQTAEDKALKLIEKLIFATGSVVLLVLLTLGRREAVIVGMAVFITLTITLFASWAAGFTLNRVSLFALIFSIGILVDDAIVVVENIHRHLQQGGKSLREAIPLAVDEVGGPTILATFTVIAALLPMAFVRGLMGPYMSPIPINASMGMLISLAVAFILTPWLALKLLGRAAEHHGHSESRLDLWLINTFRQRMMPFLRGRDGRGARVKLLAGILIAIVLSMGLAVVQLVVLKMLPFDNKSEFQVVVDMPAGTPLEETERVLQALGRHLATVPEVTDFQTYAGTAAPINFNGLVRQYYLRRESWQGDIQVNLVDKGERDRQSHAIALAVRAPLQEIAQRYQANVKIVEVPPGPPVLAPIVAEVYGLDHAQQVETAQHIAMAFRQTAGIVDVDTTLEAPQKKWQLTVDQARAARLGVDQAQVVAAIAMAVQGSDLSFLHDQNAKYAVPIRTEFSAGDKADIETLRSLRVRARNGALVPLADVTQLVHTTRDQTLYHKDLLPVVYVTGDMAGDNDSPLYGVAGISNRIGEMNLLDGKPADQLLISQPDVANRPSLKWDGEWQITYETFRDMGLAYSVGLILIYLLVVAQFHSYGVPLIIMAPIPLTMIGIMPGHALLGAQFTATSMIGMIALAGIIVRNSILLVDFVRQETARGIALQEAVIQAAAVRTKPIVLTGLAAMMGAFFILDDPIFSGLAVSLIFGIFVSTLLTLFVIPVVYYAYHYEAEERATREQA